MIDRFLNGITMYRLVLYVLVAYLAAAFGLSFFHVLPFTPWMLLLSTAVILLLCRVTNEIFAKAFDAPVNAESYFITALILVCLITPPRSPADAAFYEFAAWAAVWAMAGKFIIAIRRKHLFNPAAFAVALTALTMNDAAGWWVGTASMAPFVLAGGLLITRKIRRFDLVISFLIAALIAMVGLHMGDAVTAGVMMRRGLLMTPLLFFATIMLTEPLTTPPTRAMRLVYGVFTGALFAPSIHFGSFFLTPELALLLGNVFSFVVSPKEKLLLRFQRKSQVADKVYDFLFRSDRPFTFVPGQYLEWTLAHARPDTRGNRRYLTIASSPTEEGIAIGVKFHEPASTFKKKLLALKPGDTIVASQRAGEFVLPRDRTKKLVFVAGGIGITPFRSMVRSLSDRGERRDIILLYANRTKEDIAYRDVFDAAQKTIGLQTVYTLTDRNAVPADWTGRTGHFDAAAIRAEVPDYLEREFYLSGTHAMVTSCGEVLRSMGIARSRIRKDFFPGFA
ncbi:MAG: RnfABCDGE type electron transport complex subunit D [Candidatus Peribacteraceae bacterium]|nr:RnfABCDGE type electron transport complex subunit D [Candidatus Peribacteraceae bacterium]MDD5742998.1 RnfABCDGE type electron transport complex subunit D [Candidatus Peribacteraceae bacterium]